MEDNREVKTRLIAGVGAFALALAAAGCGDNSSNTNTTANASLSNTNTNTNTLAVANANVSETAAGTRVGPDNSEVTTETAGGVTTETRTFRDPHSRVERVVVTTRGGQRTARVYYRNKTVKELPESEVGQALAATGDALVSAGGKVVDVSKEVGGAVADKVEDAPDKVDDAARAAGGAAKKAGSEAADKAEDVGGAAASGAKKAGKATARGAKKVGGAIKNAVTP
jgi:hypothetical protein